MRKVAAYFRERRRRRRLQRARPPQQSFLERLRGYAVRAGLAFAVIAFGLALLVVIKELVENSVAIETFSVPPSFEEQGYTGRVLAMRLIDRLGEINRQVKEDAPRQAFAADWQRQTIDLPVPEMNTSLHAIVGVIRDLLGKQQQTFTCEIVHGDAATLRVWARLNDHEPFDRSYPAATSIDTIVDDLASYFGQEAQPVTYAAYICGRTDDPNPDGCNAAIGRILGHADAVDAMWALNFLGNRQKLTDPHGAIDTYSHAISIGCGEATRKTRTICSYLYNNRGTLYRSERNTNAAIADLAIANRLRPDDSEIIVNLGLAYELRDRRRAIALYTRASEKTPSDVGALVYRGLLRYTSNELDAAVADFNRAIKINPTFALAYLSRARVFQQRRNRVDAEKDFAMAVLLDGKMTAEVEQLRNADQPQAVLAEMRP